MTPLEKILRQPAYALLAIVIMTGMLVLYTYTQLLGNLDNMDVWISNLPLGHGILLGIFILLFGITMAYQIHLWVSPQTCSVEKRAKGTGASGIGTIGIFLVAQCPACASLGALFLPVSAITFFSEYAVWINLVSIGMMLFTLHYLGAFGKTK